MVMLLKFQSVLFQFNNNFNIFQSGRFLVGWLKNAAQKPWFSLHWNPGPNREHGPVLLVVLAWKNGWGLIFPPVMVNCDDKTMVSLTQDLDARVGYPHSGCLDYLSMENRDRAWGFFGYPMFRQTPFFGCLQIGCPAVTQWCSLDHLPNGIKYRYNSLQFPIFEAHVPKSYTYISIYFTGK